MDSKRNEIKVGIAVLISLVILIGGIMWGKGYRLRASRYSIEVIFDNVGGLEPGSNVLANGVEKGRVTAIELTEGKVHVRASVDRSVTLYSDYRISIESPTVMPGKVLALYPGGQIPPTDITKPLKGESPMGVGEAVGLFEDISAQFKVALGNVNTLVYNLNAIVGDSANQQHVSGLLAESHGAAQTTNEWLKENRDRLTESLIRLENTLASVESLVQNTDARLATTLTRADSALLELTQTGTTVRSLMTKIEGGEGSVGKLVTDEEFYKRLNATLAQIDSLAYQIRTKGMRQKIVLF